jgi:periplasmic protein TonB
VSARHLTSAARWGICFALVLSVHAAGAAALLAHWTESPDAVANAPVMMVELAPLPVAPQTQPSDAPPEPKQAEAQSQQEKASEKAEIKLAPAIEADLTAALPPKLVDKLHETKQRQKLASLASAASTAEQKARRAAAAAPGALSHDPSALPNWKSALVAQLERYKRYPSEAQARGEYGVAQLAFSVDRSGGVHHARILHSSGSSALDSATLDLVERAQPLPPPPSEIQGAQIAIVVPIRYSMR